MNEFDLVVIGGGSGGLAGAFRAAGHGARVAVLEPGPLGGTCVNVGCVPKKAMWLAAGLAQKFQMGPALGFSGGPPQLDWKEFIVNRQRYISGIHASYRKRLDEGGIMWMPCRGQLQGDGKVLTDTGNLLRARHILLATGGYPTRPAISGAELAGTSDDFFNLCDPPARVAVVGGGYIAVELAGVLQALGSHVDMLVRGARLLKEFDDDLTDALAENSRQHGIHLHFDYSLQALEKHPAGGVQTVDKQGQRQRYDQVLFATGRQPNTHQLGLEAAGVTLTGSGHIQVNEYQDTSAGGIHAVGDVASELALTPVAIGAARRLMDRLFAGHADARLDYTNVATVVFAHPPLGTVGLSEKQARERHGDQVKVFKASFRPMLDALADSPQRSLFKLVCVGEEETVVGLHLLGEAADEILQGFAVAIKKGIRRRDLEETVAIHPTSAEEVVLLR